jgi:hypothetical protein
VPEMPPVKPYLGYRTLLNPVFRSTAPETPKMSAEAALSIWSLLHGLVVLDQGNLLQESRPEQERIAVQGVLAVLRGFSELRDV